MNDISNNQIDKLDKRDDGEFEILDVKFDKRNTKNLKNTEKLKLMRNLQKINNNVQNKTSQNVLLNNAFKEKVTKRFSMPDRRKGYIQKATIKP